MSIALSVGGAVVCSLVRSWLIECIQSLIKPYCCGGARFIRFGHAAITDSTKKSTVEEFVLGQRRLPGQYGFDPDLLLSGPNGFTGRFRWQTALGAPGRPSRTGEEIGPGDR